METTVTERGQTAIPARIRRKYNLKAHTKLIWLDLGETISVVPASKDPIKSLRGMFKGAGLTQSLLADRRRDREREDRFFR